MMNQNNTKFRIIDFSFESCPPKWCPINLANPLETEDCCHGCKYLKIIGEFEEVYCDYSVSEKKEIRQ